MEGNFNKRKNLLPQLKEISEEFIHYLWKHQLFSNELITTTGNKLIILKSGEHNHNSGPDFFNGRIKMDDTTWAGNIEIHVKSSDWVHHKHQNDSAYENIILHVVFTDDKPIHRNSGEQIPTLEIRNSFDYSILEKYQAFQSSDKWIPCENLVAEIGHFEKNSWMDSLSTERLQQKSTLIEQGLKTCSNNFQEVFYISLAKNFGFKTNGDAFELLAKSLPLRVIEKHKSDLFQIEALLFGVSGLLTDQFKDEYPQKLYKEFEFLKEKYGLIPVESKLWKFMRMRPSNFPTIRISQFAQLMFNLSGLIHQIFEAEKLEDVIYLLKVSSSDYWRTHYQFDSESIEKTKKIGNSSVNLILINTIIPFLFVYGNIKNDNQIQEKAIAWLEKIKPETNHIVQKFKDIGLKPHNANHSQGLLQLKQHYCDKRRCLECRFGHSLLNRKTNQL